MHKRSLDDNDEFWRGQAQPSSTRGTQRTLFCSRCWSLTGLTHGCVIAVC